MSPDGGQPPAPPPVAPDEARHVLASGTMALDTVDGPSGSGRDLPGGSALYFSLAASLLAPVRLIGIVGTDFPRSCLDGLRGRGVDTTGVRREMGPTMRWRARYSHDFRTRRTLFTDRGVAAHASPIVPPEAAASEVVFLGSTDPDHQAQVLDQTDRPTLVAVDTMTHWIEERPARLQGLVSRAHVLFLTRAEAQALGGKLDLTEAADSIRMRGPSWVVAKLGADGARAFGPQCTLAVPAAPADDVRDPTGAGDAFAGGVVGYLAGAPSLDASVLETALRFGAAAASLAIERLGTSGLEGGDTAELVSRAAKVRPLPPKGRST